MWGIFWAVCLALTATNLFTVMMLQENRRQRGILHEAGLREGQLFCQRVLSMVETSAYTKSIDLLRDWLTDAQWAQYKKKNYFDVVGSAGGHYRINGPQAGSVMPFNIDALDAKPRNSLCIVPAPSTYMEPMLPAGDVLLTQKIALETDELEVLKRCNWRGTGRWASADWTPSTIRARLVDAPIGVADPTVVLAEPDSDIPY